METYATSITSALVLGAGKSGISALKLLRERIAPNATLYVCADVFPEKNPQFDELCSAGVVCLKQEDLTAHSFDLCVASPGISVFSDLFKAAQNASRKVIGEPELAWYAHPKNWICVTGTNGKTTTTTLIEKMLVASGVFAVAAGNIGDTLCDVVNTVAEDTWVVAELSSYQLATVDALEPTIACLVNIDNDHIRWHKTHEHYVASKKNIFKNLATTSLAVVGTHDAEATAIADELIDRGQQVSEVSAHTNPEHLPRAYVSRDGMLCIEREGDVLELLPEKDLRMLGKHNVLNALIAAVASLEAGATKEGVVEVLANFSGLEHRIELVDADSPVAFYNDSKATNTDACLQALAALAGKTPILLVGGHDKGEDLQTFADVVAGQVRAAICFGDARKRFSAALLAAGVHAIMAYKLKDAVACAVAMAKPGDTVLLSPAASSFDEFGSFEERGDAFKAYVKELA